MEIEGTLADSLDLSKYRAGIDLRFMNHLSSAGTYYYSLGNESNDYINTSFQENERKLILTPKQYGIYADFDEYMISDYIN